MLLFFTSLTCMCFCYFRNQQRTDPLGFDWWVWLILTGISLGCVLSIKWVGLFAITLVGLFTLEDLWVMLGDLKMPIVHSSSIHLIEYSENIRESLDCKNFWSHCYPLCDLYVLILVAFCHLES